MAGTKMTFLVCFDDHRNFTDDVRKRFSDNTKYNVTTFFTQQEFTDHFKKEIENKSCKVAIIGVPDAMEQFNVIENMTLEVKRVDPKTGIILLIPAEKMAAVKKEVKLNIDAYVPRNTNAVLRIHNTVKKLISEHNITIFRKRRNFSLYVFLVFLMLSALLVLIAFLKLPQYF